MAAENNFALDKWQAQKTLLERLGIEAPIVFDVGANVGQTARAYKEIFPASHIYCFEPFPESIEAIKKNFCEDTSVKVVPFAVSDRAGKSTLHINGISTTNSLFPRVRNKRRYFRKKAEGDAEIEIETITIDDFVRENDLEVDVLKLDLQGGEFLAVQGANKVLSTGKIPIIMTEAMFVEHYEGPPLFQALWHMLSEYDYSLYQLYLGGTAKNGQLRQGDAIFVSKIFRETVLDKWEEEL